MDDKQFPMLWQGDRKFLARLKELGCPKSVPWQFVAAHAEQCGHNHSQDPETLARRGGLDPREMVAVVGDRHYRHMKLEDAVQELNELVRQYTEKHQ